MQKINQVFSLNMEIGDERICLWVNIKEILQLDNRMYKNIFDWTVFNSRSVKFV